jgi:peptidoglycan/xylan/chitin deacetylase (PgdA/CDA1 family)
VIYRSKVVKLATLLFNSNIITFVSYVDSLDWKDTATPDSICQRVTSKVQNGSIVLFHNDADHTLDALPNILKCLKDEGYEFVFISDLIYKDNYEIIHDGTQCKIKDG